MRLYGAILESALYQLLIVFAVRPLILSPIRYFGGTKSELEAGRHLPLARDVIADRIEDAAGDARAIDAAIWLAKIGVIGEVE